MQQQRRAFKECPSGLKDRELRQFRDAIRQNRSLRLEVLRSQNARTSCAQSLLNDMKQKECLILTNDQEMNLLLQLMKEVQAEALDAEAEAQAQSEDFMAYEEQLLEAQLALLGT